MELRVVENRLIEGGIINLKLVYVFLAGCSSETPLFKGCMDKI